MKFFYISKQSKSKVNCGGPKGEDQLLAMANDKSWIVLNTDRLRICKKGTIFCDRANAFKHALQTYGPYNNLPDFRHNEGQAKNHIFHGHVNDSKGKTFVLEWAIVNREKRIMALMGFSTHENYKFCQKPLSEAECDKIMTSDKNIRIINNTREKIKEVKNKVNDIKLKNDPVNPDWKNLP